MSEKGLVCVKTSTLAAGVEASRRNCIPESQILLHARDVMPSWRIVFSTFRGCMSFYTARVIFHPRPSNRRRLAKHIGEVDSVRHEPTGRDERTDVVHAGKWCRAASATMTSR